MTNDTFYFSIIVIELRVRYFTSLLTFSVWFSSVNFCLNSVKNTAKEKKKKKPKKTKRINLKTRKSRNIYRKLEHGQVEELSTATLN